MGSTRFKALKTTASFLAAVVLTAAAGFGEAVTSSVPNSRFIYSTEEKLGFDLEQYLSHAAPHLLPHAEVISHWSGYTTISPRIVLALMELRTDQIRGKPSKADELPFGELSTAVTFSGQVEDVLLRLAKAFYARPTGADGLRAAPAAREALEKVLGKSFDAEELGAIYANLFPAEPPLPEALSAPGADKVLPPTNYLQLSYPVGQGWYHGGTHTFTGQDPGPPSSLDFTRNREPWGADTTNTWVVAAHPGTAVVYSSCNVEVLGSDGWSTSYYHLDNVVVAGGQTVRRDQRLSNYADNLDQAICQGGHSTLPHVHFSLRRHGQYVSLQDVRLSGYRVEAGRFSYDTDCQFFWLERDDFRHCAWADRVPNPGVFVPPPAPLAPSNLTAQALSPYEIRLQWRDRSGNESGFEIERREADGTDSFTRIATVGANTVEYVSSGLTPATPYVFRVRAVNAGGVSGYSGEAHSGTFAEDPQPCFAGGESPCLRDRFEIEVSWRNHDGDRGSARQVQGSEDSAVLWFFDDDNWEMLVKVIDGCGFNDHYWVFAAATTDVEYSLRVIDTLTGQVAFYYNPLGNAADATTDTAALATCP